ncbi:hypothetical protein FY557_15420 [Chryseobacterium sp. SN22]|uniref:hypothetical protein n=1 Tax=Chryseobacterium sp. SN22 TaxID=2606431 RepID=UPI0011F00411|nr:hypothetical protein [Chryseobacterium sp. SN22]KAA0126821.1 hypothetical protein FY557_15420 [Chryseobacterium sp. SN22]
MKTKQELKLRFENGDIPNQNDFWEWQDSYFHKEDKIPAGTLDYDFSKKADLVDGKIPASQLPSYVDDVLEYNLLSDFPKAGESGKIYIEIRTGKQFRWSGERYIQIIDTSAFQDLLLAKLDKPTETLNKAESRHFIPLLEPDNSTKKVPVNDLKKDFFITASTFLTEEEKINWRTQMNGGWTTNTMSVAYIVPPIIDQTDKNTWFTLKGTGLNLNPANFSISLMTATGDLLLIVPNSQVQLFQNGTDLIFYYNCSSLAEGEYKIMISNGVASYITSSTVTVSNRLSQVDLSATQWDRKLYNDADSKSIYGRGNTGVFSTDPNVKPLERDNTFIASLITKPLIKENQDFILRGSFNLNIYNLDYTGTPEYYFGLTTADTVPELSNQAFPVIRMGYAAGAIKWYCQLNESSLGYATNYYSSAVQGNFSFIRKGNTLFSSVTLNTGTFTQIGNITQKALKFGMFCQNNGSKTDVSAVMQELIIL